MDRPDTEILFENSDEGPVEGKQLPVRTADDVIVIPVIQEEIEVRKHQFATGTVRIRKVVHERDEVIEESTIHRTVEIERVPINSIVGEPPPIRHEGPTTIYSVVEEVLVLTKQFVLKEEVRITNRVSESPRRQSITLRTEELVIDREEETRTNSV